MSGYLYMLQPKANNDGNKGIKIGMSKNFKARLEGKEYRNCIVIQCSYVNNVNSAENDLKKMMRKKFKLLEGTETFVIEDIAEGLDVFNEIVRTYVINHDMLKQKHDEKTVEIKKLADFDTSTFSDFEDSDECVSVKDGVISFVYSGKTLSKAKSLNDKNFGKFKAAKIKIHNGNFYVFKPGRGKGWYYIGPKNNGDLIKQLKLNWTPEMELGVKNVHNKKSVYELTEPTMSEESESECSESSSECSSE